MDIVPWRPFREIGTLRRDMDSLWNRFFGETSLPSIFSQEWAPRVDVSESKDNVVVKAEIPGMDAKDMNVSVSGDILTIKGEKKKEEEKKEEHYHYRERYSGSFQRSLRLPVAVKGEKADATFKDGVLTITIPKAEEAKKKEIKIKTA